MSVSVRTQGGSGGAYASIFVTGPSASDTVSASKDGNTIVGKWTSVPNPAAHGLPNGYTELEYIESTGTQYINTGITASENVGFSLNAIMTEQPPYANRDFVFCGAASGGSSSAPFDTYRYGVWGCWASNPYNFQIASPVSTTYSSPTHIYYSGETIDIEYNISGANCIINGSEYSISRESRRANSVALFATTTDFGAGRYGRFKLTRAKIYVNGSEARNFIPCKRQSDNAVGIYDLVTNTFFGNSGTGSFAAGREIPSTIPGFSISPIRQYGTWVVSASNGTKTKSVDVLIDAADEFTVEIL